jgi:hypothetical protein
VTDVFSVSRRLGTHPSVCDHLDSRDSTEECVDGGYKLLPDTQVKGRHSRFANLLVPPTSSARFVLPSLYPAMQILDINWASIALTRGLDVGFLLIWGVKFIPPAEEETPSQSALELPFGHHSFGQGSSANQSATAQQAFGPGHSGTAGHTTVQGRTGQSTQLLSPSQEETPHQDLGPSRTAAQPNWALTQAALQQAGMLRRSSGEDAEAEASEDGSDDSLEEESDDEDETGADARPPKGPVNPGVAPKRTSLSPTTRNSQGLDKEGESEGDDDAEGGEEEEEEDTPLVFDADFPVDPLSLVDQQDEPGHEFERYTKLQYEMLAERKRKALGGGYGQGFCSCSLS